MDFSFMNLSMTTKTVMRKATNQGYGALKIFFKKEREKMRSSGWYPIPQFPVTLISISCRSLNAKNVNLPQIIYGTKLFYYLHKYWKSVFTKITIAQNILYTFLINMTASCLIKCLAFKWYSLDI